MSPGPAYVRAMPDDTPIHDAYVTSEYEEKLEWFADSNDVPREVAVDAFRGHCQELEGSFAMDAPGNVIRRIALQRLERAPPTAPTADEADGDLEPGADPTRSRRSGRSHGSGSAASIRR